MSTVKTKTKADLEAEIEALKALLAQKENTASTPAATVTPVVQQPVYTVPSTDVTLVYCSDSQGYAKISNIELYFNRYGEEFVLSRAQFDELVGKYRRWFDEGVLAVSYKNIDIAAAKGLHTDREYGLTFSKLDSIGHMTVAQLEQLWNDTELLAHRQSITSFVKRKFIEGDERYRDRAKIDLLNRLTDGGFAREQDELSGRFKIAPTEMW